MVFINAEMKERTPGITPGVPLSLISIIEAIIIRKHRPISDIFLIIRPNHVIVVEGQAAIAVCVLDEVLHQRAVHRIADCLLGAVVIVHDHAVADRSDLAGQRRCCSRKP